MNWPLALDSGTYSAQFFDVLLIVVYGLNVPVTKKKVDKNKLRKEGSVLSDSLRVEFIVIEKS